MLDPAQIPSQSRLSPALLPVQIVPKSCPNPAPFPAPVLHCFLPVSCLFPCPNPTFPSRIWHVSRLESAVGGEREGGMYGPCSQGARASIPSRMTLRALPGQLGITSGETEAQAVLR